MQTVLQFLSVGCSSRVSVERSLLYCSIVSTGFVGSLFLLVPRRVRALDRNDARQIKWRSMATLITSLASMALYPVMICSDPVQTKSTHTRTASSQLLLDRESMNAWIRATCTTCAQVLAHLALLYTGPLVKSIAEVQEYLKHRDETILHFTFWRVYYHLYLRPTVKSLFRPITSSDRWMSLRRLVIAPLTEEIVFRGCIVSAMAASTVEPRSIIWLSPLFFGTAHAHHAVSKLQQGESFGSVVAQTAVQFTYTSLFGMYSSFAYLRTGSVLAVTAGHAFCNAMGLPDMSFLNRGSLLYPRRQELLGAHVVGLAGFVVGMNAFLPHRPRET